MLGTQDFKGLEVLGSQLVFQEHSLDYTVVSQGMIALPKQMHCVRHGSGITIRVMSNRVLVTSSADMLAQEDMFEG